MAEGIINKLKYLVGIQDVDDEEFEDEVEEQPARRPIPPRTAESAPAPEPPRADYRFVANPKDKVISMNKTLNAITSQLNLVVTEPKSFDECPTLVNSLKARKPIIINLEKVETETAKKIFDFLSGATYALNGNMKKIATNIFVFVPENINVTSNAEHKGIDFSQSAKSGWR
ncbi:MAG: cell division protein SepF [Clostridiales Family XIII bacterium]|jgi:cell division inhibitor SepF|nr:cell division protein SepF [Clostridiales Family XIII bacterium]